MEENRPKILNKDVVDDGASQRVERADALVGEDNDDTAAHALRHSVLRVLQIPERERRGKAWRCVSHILELLSLFSSSFIIYLEGLSRLAREGKRNHRKAEDLRDSLHDNLVALLQGDGDTAQEAALKDGNFATLDVPRRWFFDTAVKHSLSRQGIPNQRNGR
jgi:hypothetical protein